jgi:hypothetical protein
MIQTAQSRLGDDFERSAPRRDLPAERRFLSKSQVGPVTMVLRDVLCQESFQVPLIDHDHVIEEILSAALNPSLRHAVLPGTLERGSLGAAPHGFHRSNDLEPELAIPVEEHVPMQGVQRKRFPQLLHDPGASGVAGDVHLHDAPPVMSHDKETVGNSEGDGVDGEEVHGGDDFAVVLEKGPPAIPLIRIPPYPLHPARDRALRDIEAQHL